MVRLRVELFDAQGEPLAAPSEVTYLHGGYGGLLPTLEHALEGKTPGEKLEIQLEPEQAFGEYDAALLRMEPLERYGEGVAVGMEVEEDDQVYTITDIQAGKAVLDANHPLAGMALRFAIEVLAARSARPEEIAQGVSSP